MDLGTGTFIVASALTSRYARGEKNNGNPILLFFASGCKWNRGLFLTSSFVRNGVVLLLGLGRMIVIKAIGYHEHESEYGTHWNFFVTMFCVWVIADAAHGVLPRRGWIMPALCLILLLGYQLVLVYSSLTDYILTAPRDTFFAMNKEGFCSLPGYSVLYLLTEWFSSEVFFPASSVGDVVTSPVSSGEGEVSLSPCESKEACCGDRQPPVPTFTESGRMLQRWRLLFLKPHRTQLFIVIGTALCCLVAWGLGTMVQPTSRRLANLPYVFLVLAISLINIASLMVVDILGNPATRVYIIETFSNCQLQIFIIANIITGAINMSVPTIHLCDSLGLFILSSYATVLVLIVWRMKHQDVNEKSPA